MDVIRLLCQQGVGRERERERERKREGKEKKTPKLLVQRTLLAKIGLALLHSGDEHVADGRGRQTVQASLDA